MTDAHTGIPGTDRESPQETPEAAAGFGRADNRRAAPAASAAPERSARDLAGPLAAGAAAGAVAGIVNSGAGAVLAILAGAAAGFVAVLAFRAIRPGGPGRTHAAEPSSGGPAGAEIGGDRPPDTALQDAAIELVRCLPAPAIAVDARREVLAVSRPAEELLRRAAVGRTLPDTIRHPEFLSAVQQSIEDGVGREVTIRESVPQDRHLEALIAPLDRAAPSDAPDRQEPLGERGGAPRGALILLRDLTPQIHADRMRVDLVANVSHELRTPLTSLAGFLETLRGPAANDAAAQNRFLRIMEEQTARMTRLVDTLMSLSNIELDEHRPPTGRVELNATVRRVVDALKIVADRLGSRIVVIHDLQSAEIAGDEDQIARVARNLIENAIKYGRPASAIEVRVFALGGYGMEPGEVALSVSDSGEGIPEEHLPRLTERFYRVDVARARNPAPAPAGPSEGAGSAGADQTPDSGGAGLGLAIVKHIVARHGGRLEIASEVGVGSVFTAVFPPAPAATPGADDSETPSA